MKLPVPTAPSTVQTTGRRTARVRRALLRAHVADAEREPLRTTVRNVVLATDWKDARRMPGRLRGTDRVDLDADGAPYT